MSAAGERPRVWSVPGIEGRCATVISAGQVKAEYQTFRMESQGLYKDRGSRFISYAYPVRTLAEIENHLQSLRQEHHAARHICYAYILGPDGAITRADDDGEPSSSAGRPILDSLRRAQLTNALIAVVRYFGGIKLGVPGLIEAYRTASEAAIEANQPQTRTVQWEVTLRCDYASYPDALHRLHALGASLEEERYTDSWSLLRLRWPLSRAEIAKNAITDLRQARGLTVAVESETIIE